MNSTPSTHLLDEIILASASSARKRLLEERHIPFRIQATSIDESLWCHKDGKEQALLRAQAKAQHTLQHYQGRGLIIAADQTLSWNGELFDKASSEQEAHERLEKLQNSTHHLHSAVTLAYSTPESKGVLTSFALSPALTMRPLSSKEIEKYLKTGEWKGSVGCYRIEGEGKKLFNKITSDADTIAGLPMTKLTQVLKPYNIHLHAPLSLPLHLTLP